MTPRRPAARGVSRRHARRDRRRRAPALDAAPAFPDAAFRRARRRRRARHRRRRDRAPREWARRARRRARRRLRRADLRRPPERASSGSPSPRPSRCAPAELAAVRTASCGSASGAPTRAPGEGEPARIGPAATARLHGEKMFCSGAGGLDRALVLARSGEGPPRSSTSTSPTGVEVDRDWYRAGGMRASESHRVRFHGAPVLAVLGEPGELGARAVVLARRDPHRGRLGGHRRRRRRRARSADLAARGERRRPAARSPPGASRPPARRSTAGSSTRAARADADPEAGLRTLRVQLREAIADAGAHDPRRGGRARAARARSPPARALDRARRDFELFVLQHRLDPMVARLGRGRRCE